MSPRVLVSSRSGADPGGYPRRDTGPSPANGIGTVRRRRHSRPTWPRSRPLAAPSWNEATWSRASIRPDGGRRLDSGEQAGEAISTNAAASFVGSHRRRGRMLLAGLAVWKSSASVQHSMSAMQHQHRFPVRPAPACSEHRARLDHGFPHAASLRPSTAVSRAKAPVSQAWTQFADIKRVRYGGGLGRAIRRASRHSGSTGSVSADMPDRSL
jgi:hypothetical protein